MNIKLDSLRTHLEASALLRSLSVNINEPFHMSGIVLQVLVQSVRCRRRYATFRVKCAALHPVDITSVPLPVKDAR